MNDFKFLFLLCLLSLFYLSSFSQRISNSSRTTIGYIEDNRFLNASRETIGYISDERILDAKRRTVGYFID